MDLERRKRMMWLDNTFYFGCYNLDLLFGCWNCQRMTTFQWKLSTSPCAWSVIISHCNLCKCDFKMCSTCSQMLKSFSNPPHVVAQCDSYSGAICTLLLNRCCSIEDQMFPGKWWQCLDCDADEHTKSHAHFWHLSLHKKRQNDSE